MSRIPDLVIERIIVYADIAAIVALASCSRQLWMHISQLQAIWRRRYHEYYSLNDDREVKWMTWYRKTLRTSTSSISSSSTKGITVKHDGINWFRAFCQRRATDINWFRNSQDQLRSITKDVHGNDRVIVLQRIFRRHIGLKKCCIIEQCQPINGTTRDRFWRLRKLNYTNITQKAVVRRVLMSDTYLMVLISSQDYALDTEDSTGNILVWPIHRVATMEPRRLFYPYRNNISIRGNWALFHCLLEESNLALRYKVVSVNVLNLATGQISSNTFGGPISVTFLQRVTDDTVVVFSACANTSHRPFNVDWHVWQFSNSNTEHSNRCLLTGSFNTWQFNELLPPIERLDNDRVLVKCAYHYKKDFPNVDDNDHITTLAVISTRYHNSNRQPIHEHPPVWSRHALMLFAKAFVSLDQVITMSDKGWTIYNLSNGDMLTFTSIDTIQPLFDEYCIPDIHDHLKNTAIYVQNYILCESIDHYSYVVIDVLNPTRTTVRKIDHILEYYKVKTSDAIVSDDLWEQQWYSKLHRTSTIKDKLLNIKICSVNAMLIEHNYQQIMVDLSI
ncbi:hypothetical protein BDF22DRAFT_663488 [Syncephalis plumigaleata]|nr:hypothetical protein BDF22DRAFT_663488 [Syncephalis plumigaleata]